jgi:phosphoribosylformylglycinamidine (FGAM) synthase-like amidotransferase family enzyme
MVDVAKAWVKDRLGERTSLDGVALVAVCGGFLMFDGLMSIVAWAGLAYGIYTLVQKG